MVSLLHSVIALGAENAMRTIKIVGLVLFMAMFGNAASSYAKDAKSTDLWDRVEHHYANSNGVKIHYVALGKGPLVVMIHGFPDFWYTWRDQMRVLSAQYRVVAVDQRGYDLSGRPPGIEQYAMPLLVDDIGAVIKAEGRSKAVIVGHDWGGAVAWTLAMTHPDWIQALIILNLPHPYGIQREIKNNPEQRKNSQYAFNFQKPGAEKTLSPEKLAAWVKDDKARVHYIEAFERSDFEAMLNYYRANYPRPSQTADASDASAPQPPSTPPPPPPPKVKVPVLEFHGLADQALLPGALSGTWDLVDEDFTLVTIPGAGHFVQQDASALVTATMSDWLKRRIPPANQTLTEP
jgi:pimeloyl-ACP methyl ester carboxylesterase